MDREIQGLEATYWATRNPAEGTAALESLAAAVLNLPEADPHLAEGGLIAWTRRPWLISAR
jgi:hypothetical protein